MTYAAADRVFETSTTTGTGTYTLDGAEPGFQTFSVIGANNYCTYFATDNVDWEVGIGQVLTAPARLVRESVIASSNSGAEVDWGAGTRYIGCGPMASEGAPRVNSKSIAGSGSVTLTQEEQRCDVLILTGLLTGNRTVVVDATPWHWLIVNSTTGTGYTVTVKVTGQTGITITQGKSKVAYNDGTDVEEGQSDTDAILSLIGPIASTSGRLTLSTGVPVTTADVTGATTIYFTPYKGDRASVYDGSAWVVRQFAELSQATSDSTKSPAAVVAEAMYDLFLWYDAGTMRCTRGPAWLKSATVTMTIAAPCVVTSASHGLRHGAPIVFTTTGALPTGLTAGTVYYISKIDANSYNVCASFADVVAGTLITTTGSQSGVHTATNRDTDRSTGAGTTELEWFEGRLVNKNAITNGPAARCGLYVGSVGADASAQINSATTNRSVWNYFNRVVRSMAAPVETADTYTYTSAAWRIANANAASLLKYVIGWSEDSVKAWATGWAENTNASVAWRIGVGADSLSELAATAINTRGESAGANDGMNSSSFYEGIPGIGRHYLARLEYSTASGTTTWQGDNALAAGIQQHTIIGEMMG